MEKDKCETCEHNNDSGTEYCGACAGGVESNWKEASSIKKEKIADLEKQLSKKSEEAEKYKDEIEKQAVEIEELDKKLSEKFMTVEEVEKVIIDFAQKKYCKDERTIHLIFDSSGMRKLASALTRLPKQQEAMEESLKNILSQYYNCDNLNCGNGAICNYCSLKLDIEKALTHLSKDITPSKIARTANNEIVAITYEGKQYYPKELHPAVQSRMGEEDISKEFIKKHYDEFLGYYYHSPCAGCKDGHPSFWKTIIESDEWKKWEASNPMYDFAECEELGIIGEKHFKAFIAFIAKQALKENK